MGEPVRKKHYLLRVTTSVSMAALIALSVNHSVSNVAVAAPVSAGPAASKQQTTKQPTDEERLAKALEDIERTLYDHQRKSSHGKSVTAEEDSIKKLSTDLDGLNAKALQGFARVGKELEAMSASNVIKQRHRNALAKYQAEMATLKGNLKAINTAKDKAGRAAAVKKAKAHLEALSKGHKRRPNDPNHNPMRALQPIKNNKPKTSKDQFRAANLFNTPSVQLAAAGDFTFDKLPGANNPAYLATTPEVVLSDAIKAKAAELNHDPVAIFNYVHDNTEWLPTWGAIQNADMALLSQKGNAFDLASLLIALYRASGIPARYVHGTIDVPVDKLMNWAGGFTDVNSAWDYVSSTGLPISAVTSSGKIIAFRMEHIWVEAAIDFVPYRGAKNQAADTWVQLDPSFKQYVVERGYDMHALMNFNGDQYFMEYLTSPLDLTPRQFYSTKVTNYLNTNIPNWTLKALYGHERIVPIKPVTNGNIGVFSASLPYKIVLKGYTAAQIGDSLRHKVIIGIAGVSSSYTIALPELGNDRLTFSYVPETPEDEAIAQAYGTVYDAPAYLVHLKPQIRKKGQIVAQGSGAGMGEKQSLGIQFLSPNLISNPVSNQITVGSYSAIVIEGHNPSIDMPSRSMSTLRQYISNNRLGEKANDNNLGQLLFSFGKLWSFDVGYDRNYYSNTLHTVYAQLRSEAIVTADLSVSFFFGIPNTVKGDFITMDIDIDVMAVGVTNGNERRRKDFMTLAGLSGSSWEGFELESALGGYGVSSVEIIKTASRIGVPIYSITQSNIGETLPLLALPYDDITDIRNYVSAGYEVTVPGTETQIGRWRGTGYIVLDPATKSGPYLISGGLAGGGMACGGLSDSRPCTLKEWEKDIYDYSFLVSTIRDMIVAHAKEKDGDPYGLGCKDPRTGVPNQYCADNVGIGLDWIDCSGLIAYSYYRVGFPFLRGKVNEKTGECCSEYFNVQSQWDFIASTNFGKVSIPLSQVKAGDLIFWYGGWTSKLNPPQPRIDHIGIVTYVGATLAETKWIAAEGRPWSMVGEFDFSDFGSGRLDRFYGFATVFDDN